MAILLLSLISLYLLTEKAHLNKELKSWKAMGKSLTGSTKINVVRMVLLRNLKNESVYTGDCFTNLDDDLYYKIQKRDL